jgi:glutathione S-transferase
MKSDWKTPEFLANYPLGYLPALQDGDLYLSESGAIAEYGKSSFPSPRCAAS